MLDFIFRRGNPTNGWQREDDLILAAALDEPSLNGVTIGSRFDRLSAFGRNDVEQFGTLCYFDLGVGLEQAEDGTFRGFTIVGKDEEGDFQPYRGTLSWERKPLDLQQLTRDNLTSVFGDWYWMDSDDNEFIAFYEYPTYEIQIEIDGSGAIQRLIVTNDPLMADAEQRESYQVDKPWPPYGV